MIPVSPEVKTRLGRLGEGRETWDDTLNRVLAVYEATAGAIPANEEAMSFFLEEHHASKNTATSSTLSQLFKELQEHREADAKARMKGDNKP